MYFCCGKVNKDAPGCKFDMHRAFKDSEGDDDFEGENKPKVKQVCNCCKGIGHVGSKCDYDPNYHTTDADNVM